MNNWIEKRCFSVPLTFGFVNFYLVYFLSNLCLRHSVQISMNVFMLRTEQELRELTKFAGIYSIKASEYDKRPAA